ncbi:hypothetical protein B0H34DRAFT_70255 [Crassisporium funariophilum]|nr:hypothetical protein B0H34DRAFT_70255 [Crassisporium funariophilum]
MIVPVSLLSPETITHSHLYLPHNAKFGSLIHMEFPTSNDRATPGTRPKIPHRGISCMTTNDPKYSPIPSVKVEQCSGSEPPLPANIFPTNQDAKYLVVPPRMDGPRRSQRAIQDKHKQILVCDGIKVVKEKNKIKSKQPTKKDCSSKLNRAKRTAATAGNILGPRKS